MYPAFYIAYFLTAIAFGLLAAFRTKKEHFSIAMPYILFTLLLPSVGFGLWHHAREKAENPKEAESPGHYILTKMAWVHGVYPAMFAACAFYLECFYYEYFNWDRVVEVLGISMFAMLIAGIPILGVYAFITMILPALIGNGLKKPPPVRTEAAEDIVNAPKWNRNTVFDENSYRVKDEFIPLDDEDDDFIIDL